MVKRANLFLLTGVLWICLVCSAGYLLLIRPGIGTRWRQEPAPPEALSRLELGKVGEILGYTSNGTIYEFHKSYRTPSQWEKTSVPSGVSIVGGRCTPNVSNRIVWPPPGKVKSRVNESCIYIESAYHLEVALLENGEVWSWQHEAYVYADLFIGFFLFIALTIGASILLFGIGLIIYKKASKIHQGE